MKIVILAAGKGSRLGGSLPKPLTPMSTGKSILTHQLENLSRYISLEHVIVVVGYRKEMIVEKFPYLHCVFCPNFENENTSKSLLRALKECEEDVLWLNGDVVFHPAVLKPLFDDPKSSMVVNVGDVGEEEVKYRIGVDGNILEVSKQVVNAQGEALGINLIAHKDLDGFRRQLELCQPNDYFEKAIEECIEEGMVVKGVVIDEGFCVEVDFPEDLERANTLAQKYLE